MQEGSLTIQLSQDDHWAIKGLQGPWNTDIDEFFIGSAVAIKDETFGNRGIQLQYNEGSPRGYIGDGVNAFWKFDGAKLTWKAANTELDADGNFQCTGGTIGGWTIGATTLANGTNIILDASNKAISINDATFGHKGIQIQYNGGNPQFYAGDGVSKWVKYENGALQLAEGEVKKVTLTDALLLGDGSTISGTITLNIAEGQGDCYIAAGKSDFTNVDAGFILGQDDSDSNKAKLYIGNSTDYLNWDGSNLTINVAGSDAIIISSGGDVKLVGDGSDPGLVKFYGTSYVTTFGPWHANGSIIELRPDGAGDDGNVSINIGTSTRRFNGIALWTDGSPLQLNSYVDSSNYSGISVLTSSGSYSEIEIPLKYDGALHGIKFYHDADELWFGPTDNKAWDLGQSSTAWDDAYADDWNNVADFFHLDDRPDLAVIQNIKGSGVIDKRTGLELIDDKTLPQWLLAKDKNTGDVLYDADGKPYISLKTAISLNWGAIKELKAEVDSLKTQLTDVKNRI